MLARINCELTGRFPIDRFEHEARWNAAERAVEMDLVSQASRSVMVGERHPVVREVGKDERLVA